MNNTLRKDGLNARKLILVSVLGAITIVLGMTPLGFIPLGVINATTMHIPVIIASIVEGPIVGALVGLIFGISSLLNALIKNASPVAFVFYNPLISIFPRVLIGITSYYAWSLLKNLKTDKIKILSRIIWSVISIFLAFQCINGFSDMSQLNKICMGIFLAASLAMTIYSFLKIDDNFPVVVGAFIGSMTNTIFVLGGIYLFYAKRYMEAMNMPLENAKAAILGVSITSGIPEAIISVIITSAVVKALKLSKEF